MARPLLRRARNRAVGLVALAALAGAALVTSAAPAGASGPNAVEPIAQCTANTLARNDDGSTGQITLPFSVNFFGTTFSHLWVNNNGNVTFDAALGSFTGQPMSTATHPMIAPFWSDVDTRNLASSEVTYGATPDNSTFCVNWVNVGYFGSHADKLNSFQLLLIDRSSVGSPGDFDIVLNYDQIQWETGDASGGSGGFGGSSASVGYTNGGSHVFSFAGSLTPGSFLDSNPNGLIHNSLNSPQLGRYIFLARGGAVIGGTAGQAEVQVTRIAGDDRIGTSVEASRGFKDGTAMAAVLASADAFPDALVGVPLAVAKGGPLLLTHGGSLDSRVQAELGRVLPSGSTVYLLGGTTALGSAVAAAVQGAGFNVMRFAGTDRYGTALSVAHDGLGDPSTLLLATGTDFADALAGGPAAAKATGAILLTAGSTMPSAVAGYIGAHGSASRFALGGPAAAADPGATPLVGADRFETAVDVARQFFLNPTAAGLANGFAFPDGLSGGAHIGARGGPLLLVNGDNIPDVTHTYLRGHRGQIGAAYVYGGFDVINDTVKNAAKADLN